MFYVAGVQWKECYHLNVREAEMLSYDQATLNHCGSIQMYQAGNLTVKEQKSSENKHFHSLNYRTMHSEEIDMTALIECNPF